MNEYLIHLSILVCIYLIFAQAYNIPFGLGRLFNLAHVASYAVGAYVAGLGATQLNFSFWQSIVCGAALSGLFSLLIGGIALRLTSDYFAIGSLAFGAVIHALLINWKDVTRGVLGIPGIPRPEMFGIDFYSNTNFLYLLIAANIVIQTFLWFLFTGPASRKLRAQAEFNHAALALGINSRLANIFAFFIGSLLAGVAGVFFAYYLNYIDPSSFSLTESIFVTTIVVVGRPGSFFGCFAATFFLILLPEPLRFIDIPPSVLGPMRQLLYACILYTVVYLNRSKIFPKERTI